MNAGVLGGGGGGGGKVSHDVSLSEMAVSTKNTAMRNGFLHVFGGAAFLSPVADTHTAVLWVKGWIDGLSNRRTALFRNNRWPVCAVGRVGEGGASHLSRYRSFERMPLLYIYILYFRYH